MAVQKKWPAARCLSHRWYGQQLCWSRRGPRVALERSLRRRSMRYDADRRRGVSFSGSETAGQKLSSPTQLLWDTAATATTAAAAADALDRVAGMIKKAVYRSSGRRIRTVGRCCRVRLCCMTALRCIVYGRCMSHDRCTFHGVRQVYAAMQSGLTLPDATYYSSAAHSAVLD